VYDYSTQGHATLTRPKLLSSDPLAHIFPFLGDQTRSPRIIARH
jgi:hypothetical protein